MGFSRCNKIPRCSAYDIGESNQVPASGLWPRSGSKVNQFVHVPTSVSHATFHPNPCTPFWVILLTDRQTDKRTRAKTYTSFFVGGKINGSVECMSQIAINNWWPSRASSPSWHHSDRVARHTQDHSCVARPRVSGLAFVTNDVAKVLKNTP